MKPYLGNCLNGQQDQNAGVCSTSSSPILQCMLEGNSQHDQERLISILQYFARGTRGEDICEKDKFDKSSNKKQKTPGQKWFPRHFSFQLDVSSFRSLF